MDSPHWTELTKEEMLTNRRAHLAELQKELPALTHPIDIENQLMSIGTTQAVIEFCEGYLKLFKTS